jgi:chromosome segregation ATPase
MSLSIIELSVLLTCAVILGIVIHFFIVSRRNLQTSPFAMEKLKKTIDEWKLKYFNEVEKKDRELDNLKKQLNEISENYEIYKLEAEELRKQQQKYELESEIKIKGIPTQADYIAQLLEARSSLMEHSKKVEKLMENIEEVKENDEKQQLLEDENELLEQQVKKMKEIVNQKDEEISKLVNNQSLKMEMSSMLDNAYSEFNNLQSKIQKLESQLSASKLAQIEYEGLHENYYKIHSENEEYRSRLQSLTVENQQMTLKLYEAEDKLREANFQRQQLQKRVSYLEELTRDLQMVTDANKKLEHQLRRIGELESMLNVVSEERDELLKKDSPNK